MNVLVNYIVKYVDSTKSAVAVHQRRQERMSLLKYMHNACNIESDFTFNIPANADTYDTYTVHYHSKVGVSKIIYIIYLLLSNFFYSVNMHQH